MRIKKNELKTVPFSWQFLFKVPRKEKRKKREKTFNLSSGDGDN